MGRLFSLLRHFVALAPFFFPLYLFKITVNGVPFTVTELYCYALFALWLLTLYGRPDRFSWKRVLRPYWWAGFFLFTGACVGLIFAPPQILLPSGETLDTARVGLGILKGWVLAPLLFFAVFTEVMPPADVKRALFNFVLSATLVSLAAYGFALFDSGITYDFRLKGFYESANYLSLYLAPAILVSIAFLFDRPGASRAQDLLNSACLAVMTHALFFTQSYAAILAVFGALVLYVFYLALREARHRRRALQGLGILTVTFGLILLSQINAPKFRQFLDFQNRSSTSVRLEVYRIGLTLASEHPVTGIGPGLFQANYQTRGPLILGQPPMEWNIPHPHNIFLAFWLNAGLLGLGAFLLMLVLAHRRYTLPLLALWGILLHGLFDVPFWKNDLSMVFFLILGAIVVYQTQLTAHATDSAQNRPRSARRRPARRTA